MEKLKENPGLIVAGLGAIAAAGLVMYSNMTKGSKKASANKSAASAAQGRQETQETANEEEVLENSFFLDSSLAPQEAEKLIVKWMSD